MATIKLSHSHDLSNEEAKAKITELFDAYKSRFGVSHRWDGDTLLLNGSGFDGKAKLTANRIDVEVKLGMLASAFKGQVESGLKAELEKRFTSSRQA